HQELASQFTQNYMVINAPCCYNEALAIPEQTATDQLYQYQITVPQKEKTFQVVIDIIKNSICFKAFTKSADVPEIFMQQFWYTINKASDTDSYEFLLANKKCTVNVDVFRTILDICPRIVGVEFADVPDDDTALTFLIDLGYKIRLFVNSKLAQYEQCK
ncbi:hypothetical protein Tco_1364368, partial [Tanacetum coccineum]